MKESGALLKEDVGDQQIIERILAGDKNAYSWLVRKYQKPLMRLSLRFMKDVDAAQDVVQDAFIRAFEKLASFEGRSSFKSWLFQICVNTAKNKLRERRDGFVDFSNVPLAVGAEAEAKLLQGSLTLSIQGLVDKLPERQRVALILRIYEDLSFKEIAEIMSCPYDTAKANFRHALLKLKSALSEQPDLLGSADKFEHRVMELSKQVMEV
jgi:RNA polymerase sigma-70 factor (ECF subfamily)